MNTAAHNFETIAVELIRVAPTEKARAFAEKIADRVRAMGADWIAQHENDLHVYSSADQQYFDVASNRIFFIENWQVALNKYA